MSTAQASLHCFTPALPRLRIGTSACLAGQRVRYDGSDRYQAALFERIAPHADLLPLCPEAALGIPRPPVQLVHTARGLRALGVDDACLDVTDTLLAFNAAQRPLLATLHGLVLKARSPSCGIGTAPQQQADGRHSHGDGLWAGFITREYPWLPLLDEDGLQDPAAVQQFLWRASLLCDAQAAIASGQVERFLAHHAAYPAQHGQAAATLAMLQPLHAHRPGATP